jgi:hypothetical protein
MGGKIFRNHINFHHTHYSGAHLVSRTYLGDDGNTTPYFFFPVFLVGGCAYFLLPLNVFVVMVIAGMASFCARLFRQGISLRGIAAPKVCMVPAPAGTALCSSPPREQ